MTTYPRSRRRRDVYRAPWLENPEDKVEARRFLIDTARSRLPAVRAILTLPGQTCHCVRDFRAAFPDAPILGLERDGTIHDALVEWQKHHRIDHLYTQHASVERWMETNSGSFDLVFLDYVSYPQESLVRATAAFLDRHLSRPGVAGVTVSLSPFVTNRVRRTADAFLHDLTGDERPTPDGVARVISGMASLPLEIVRTEQNKRDMAFLVFAAQG